MPISAQAKTLSFSDRDVTIMIGVDGLLAIADDTLFKLLIRQMAIVKHLHGFRIICNQQFGFCHLSRP